MARALVEALHTSDSNDLALTAAVHKPGPTLFRLWLVFEGNDSSEHNIYYGNSYKPWMTDSQIWNGRGKAKIAISHLQAESFQH
jgi:hypothetical protein